MSTQRKTKATGNVFCLQDTADRQGVGLPGIIKIFALKIPQSGTTTSALLVLHSGSINKALSGC